MRNTLLLAFIGASLLLGATSLTRGHEWGDDFASYIMQAQSILNGRTQEFVEHNSFTIFESSNQIGPVAYPWGYPLALTPMYAIKGNNPLALKLPGLFFYTGFLGCLYLMIKTRLSEAECLLITGLFAFNPLLLRFLDQIAADVPFLFFSTLALWLMVKNENHEAYEHVVLGCAIAGAFFMRATGVLLFASFFIYQCIDIWKNRRDREVFKDRLQNTLIVGATFGFLWLIYTLLFPGGGESYFAQYRDFQISTALGNANGYFQVFSQFLGEQLVWKILYYPLVAFSLVGLWIRRKEDLLFIIFFIVWMFVLITWPSWQGPRFIFPVLPIFIYFVFQGMNFFLGNLSGRYSRTGRLTIYSFWSLIAITFLVNSSLYAYSNLKNDRTINGPYDPYSKEVYKYIKEKTPAESIIVFFKPRAMRLMTEHDSIVSTECDRMLKGDYLVLSKKVGKNQQIPPEEIDDCHLPLTTVLDNNRFVVYEIQK
jgi:dolichyl-phosphate-mannose-protein mannosyltransferase